MSKFILILSLLLLNSLNIYAESFNRDNHLLMSQILVKSWKSIRDSRVVKQDLDYSCGAASIATLLSEYYQRPTSEKEILDLLVAETDKKGAASFADMEKN
jgi:predicted double-glycine peptidase